MKFDIADIFSAFAAGTAFMSIMATFIEDGWRLKPGHVEIVLMLTLLLAVNIFLIFLI